MNFCRREYRNVRIFLIQEQRNFGATQDHTLCPLGGKSVNHAEVFLFCTLDETVFDLFILNDYQFKLFLLNIISSGDILPKSLDLLQTFELECVLNTLFRGVIWHPVELLVDYLDLWDWKTDAHERIESDR